MGAFLRIDFYLQLVTSLLALIVILLPVELEDRYFPFYYIAFVNQLVSILVKMFFSNKTIYYKIHRIFFIPIWSLLLGNVNLSATSFKYNLFFLMGLPIIITVLYTYDCYKTYKNFK